MNWTSIEKRFDKESKKSDHHCCECHKFYKEFLHTTLSEVRREDREKIEDAASRVAFDSKHDEELFLDGIDKIYGKDTE